jgi:hypothetical protein
LSLENRDKQLPQNILGQDDDVPYHLAMGAEANLRKILGHLEEADVLGRLGTRLASNLAILEEAAVFSLLATNLAIAAGTGNGGERKFLALPVSLLAYLSHYLCDVNCSQRVHASSFTYRRTVTNTPARARCYARPRPEEVFPSHLLRPNPSMAQVTADNSKEAG